MKQSNNTFQVFFLLCLFALGAIAYAQLDKSEKQAADTHAAAKKSQQRIDKKDTQIRSAREEYLGNERISDVTEAYNKQLGLLLESQEQELQDLQAQLDSIAEIDRSVLPMLARMVDTLKQFIVADVPFLPKERQQRLQKLEKLLLRADVSVAEKYRQILEAYMVEVQYGRTFETYTGVLPQGEAGQRLVNFLRLGRTSLYYQTLNGQESGLWLPAQQSWKVLDGTQNFTLRQAIQIARQLKVPELIGLPLPPAPQPQAAAGSRP